MNVHSLGASATKDSLENFVKSNWLNVQLRTSTIVVQVMDDVILSMAANAKPLILGKTAKSFLITLASPMILIAKWALAQIKDASVLLVPMERNVTRHFLPV